jgi:hypothetical protein
MARFLEKGKELQRLAPYAALMAERAWLGQGDKDEALALIDLAESLSLTRAVFGELACWRQLLAADRGRSDTVGMAAPHRLLLDGWRAAAELWAEMNAPFEQGLALVRGNEAALRSALGIFERLEATPVALKVREIMRQSGVGHSPGGRARLRVPIRLV